MQGKIMRIKQKIVKNAFVCDTDSIKKAMGAIDHSGLRVVYVVSKRKGLVGAVSDSEIRKAILKGLSVNGPVGGIYNPDPVFLRERDLGCRYAVKRSIKTLLSRMPDSRYMLMVDDKNIPKGMLPLGSLLGQDAVSNRNEKNNDRRILVVGGAGYLGSVLVRKLLSRGFKVRVLDILMFGIRPIEKLLKNKNFELIENDMRDISILTKALADIDAVINLAAIVGDPACQTKPEATIETNYLANKVLAEACKYHQINRFLFSSTCSVYGAGAKDDRFSEESQLNPVSLYARSKIESEEGILSLAGGNFCPVILRMGTLYGYSPRMRFDLVVNTMTKNAVVKGEVRVYGGGRQWRPLLHVEDAAEAYAKCVEAPFDTIGNEIFNVGTEKQNYKIGRIAGIVLKCIPDTRIIVEDNAEEDPRNYFVSFSKIRNVLKFRAGHRVEDAVIRIKRAIERKEIKDVTDPQYYNSENGR